MIVAMRSGATDAELQQVLAAIEGHGPQSISLDVMQNIMDTLPALCRGKRI